MTGSSPEGFFRPDVVAAQHIPHGDPLFVRRGVRLTIHGIHVSQDDWVEGNLRVFSLDVHLRPQRNSAENLKFHAWRFENHEVLNVSAPNSVRFPIDPVAGLELGVELVRRRPDRSLAERLVRAALPGRRNSPQHLHSEGWLENSELCQLAPGGQRNRSKLRRGVYFLGSRSRPTGSMPDWGNYQFGRSLSPDPDRARQLLCLDRNRRRWLGADFSYIVFSLDYGSETGNCLT